MGGWRAPPGGPSPPAAESSTLSPTSRASSISACSSSSGPLLLPRLDPEGWDLAGRDRGRKGGGLRDTCRPCMYKPTLRTNPAC